MNDSKEAKKLPRFEIAALFTHSITRRGEGNSSSISKLADFFVLSSHFYIIIALLDETGT